MMGMGGMSGMGGIPGLGGGGGGDASSGISSASSSGCPPLYLIFARGTTELQGTFGIVGRPLCSGLQQQVPGTQCYDTVYSSDAEYMVSPTTGANTASQYMAGISSRCPNTKIVLGGYSKGAMVVHRIQGKNIVGAVTFGDPLKAQAVPTTQNWKTFCHMGDPICVNGFNMMAHLTYNSQDVPTAVQFLVAAYKSSCGGAGGGGGAAASTPAAGASTPGSDAGGSSAGGLGGGGLGGGMLGLGGMGGGMPGLGGLGSMMGGGGGGMPGLGGGLGGMPGLGGGGLMSMLGGGGMMKKRASHSFSLSRRHHHHHHRPQPQPPSP